MMKRIILCLASVLAVISLAVPARGASFSNESLRYVISYKWGMIHKDAGDAILSSHLNGKNLTFTLCAKTKPWADKFFMVRDTLISKVDSKTLFPSSYTKIAHEGGKYSKDVISFFQSNGHVSGKCTKYREKDGKISTSTTSLTSTGPTFDMLSVFYYLRTLDLTKLGKGQVTKVTIFSGSKSETLTIKTVGEEQIKLRDKSKKRALHIRFNFTTGGKKKSSDDIDCWISADNRKIPLLLIGQLPVGQVKCYYIGG